MTTCTAEPPAKASPKSAARNERSISNTLTATPKSTATTNGNANDNRNAHANAAAIDDATPATAARDDITALFRDPRDETVLLLDGYGISVTVNRGHLLLRDGLVGTAANAASPEPNAPSAAR